MNKTSKMRRVMALSTVVFALAGCDDDFMVPNFNSPAREDLTGSPTRATIAAAVRGVVTTHRGLKAGTVTRLGVWGREGYDLRPEEPRTTTDALVDPIDPLNGGLYFNGQYTQAAQVNTILTALEESPLSEAEARAVAGFVKTMKADAFTQVALARPVGVGIPLDPNPDPNGDLSPIVDKAAAWTAINALYDDAFADLTSGAGEFPFDLPSGFDGFDDPASFALANRALKARALKYQGDWGGTLAAVNASFVSRTASPDLGVYFDYSTISGDASNGFFSTVSHYAHPRIRAEAQLQPGGALDQRALDKTTEVAAFTLYDITVSESMDVYDDLNAPLPWITNDELLLIRAEAELATGDRAEAVADVNAVRTQDGGLAPLDPGFQGDLLGEILYNKLYSLLWEGGFYYLDVRQYDMLDDLPRAAATHGVYPGFPYPLNECLARGGINANPEECATYFAQ